MDKEQEEMQFLGLFGIYLESYKIILSYRKVFSKITLALILPLTFIFLAHIEISEFLLHKISHTNTEIIQTQKNSNRYEKLSDILSSEWITFCLFKFVYFTFLLVFSLLSTSAVVYTVASIYTGRDVTFRKVMSVIPKVWKRLMVTFLCTFLAFFLYNMVAILITTILFFFIILAMIFGEFKHEDIKIVNMVFLIAISILYMVGFVYMTVVWHLASVVSVMEDIKGFKAMTKSRNLIKGKMWIAIVIFFKLILSMEAIHILFQRQVLNTGSVGVVGRLGFGFLCLLLLLKVILFGLVIQTVIYFVCKSYHHENIDKSSLSDHLEVYLGEYVPLKTKDVQLEQFDV